MPIVLMIPTDFDMVVQSVKNLNNQIPIWNSFIKNRMNNEFDSVLKFAAKKRDIVMTVFEDCDKIDYVTLTERLKLMYEACKEKGYSNIVFIEQAIAYSRIDKELFLKMLSSTFHDSRLLSFMFG